MIATLNLFGSEDLFKKFEMLDGKAEALYFRNESFCIIRKLFVDEQIQFCS